MKDGRIAYRMKTPRRGSTHRVMTPMEFMARLSALVPPPYYLLVRYHGVFAPRSSYRGRSLPERRPRRFTAGLERLVGAGGGEHEADEKRAEGQKARASGGKRRRSWSRGSDVTAGL